MKGGDEEDPHFRITDEDALPKLHADFMFGSSDKSEKVIPGLVCVEKGSDAPLVVSVPEKGRI